MKFPELVPDRVCNIPVKIYRTDGLNRDGSPKKVMIFDGRCFYSEKTKQKITAEKQLITLSGEMLFNGDIAPDTDIIGCCHKIVEKSKLRPKKNILMKVPITAL